jgi:hypothetical protein
MTYPIAVMASSTNPAAVDYLALSKIAGRARHL